MTWAKGRHITDWTSQAPPRYTHFCILHLHQWHRWCLFVKKFCDCLVLKDSTCVYCIKLFLRLSIFEGERDRLWAGKEQRERKTQNPKRAPGSELSTPSSAEGWNSSTVRSCPELNLEAHLSGSCGVSFLMESFDELQIYLKYSNMNQIPQQCNGDLIQMQILFMSSGKVLCPHF